jgi:hypothetical protein
MPVDRNDAPPSILLRIIDMVDSVRPYQGVDGTIANHPPQAYRLIQALADILEHDYEDVPGLTRPLALATSGDLRRWLESGLNTPPAFDATIAAFPPPENGSPIFLLACMIATNGPQPSGRFLEAVFGYRRESQILAEAESYCGGYEKAFDCIQLTEASAGFRQGNCIVLFPESVARAKRVERQTFALFFFNKFRRIYHDLTMPEVRRLFGPEDQCFPGSGHWLSAAMTESAMYDARCLWGYLHDYAHHTGPRPLDQSLSLKIGWHTGLLEELKCDLIGALVMARKQPRYWREIIEFIIWERMLRYPRAWRDRNTFDAGTGVLLFGELWRSGAIRPGRESYLAVNLAGVLETADALVREIEDLERLDDTAYPDAARAFVEARLGAPSPPDRYDRAGTIHADVVFNADIMQS